MRRPGAKSTGGSGAGPQQRLSAEAASFVPLPLPAAGCTPPEEAAPSRGAEARGAAAPSDDDMEHDGAAAGHDEEGEVEPDGAGALPVHDAPAADEIDGEGGRERVRLGSAARRCVASARSRRCGAPRTAVGPRPTDCFGA
jgi:hypothetical protein